MTYSAARIKELDEGQQLAHESLQSVCIRATEASRCTLAPRAGEYLLQGVCRRASVLQDALANIFELFPASSTQLLDRRALANIRINLHAFLINLVGIFDNFAWAYISHHGIQIQREHVDLFKPKLQAMLPQQIREYVTSERIAKWHNLYVKNYRDALAHRVPPYIPPASVPVQHSARISSLMEIWIAAAGTRRFGEIQKEIDGLTVPCFQFAHSLQPDESSGTVLLHPQIIADARLVGEFSEVFLAHWLLAPSGEPA